MAYGFGHLDLPWALLAPNSLDGGMQHRAKVRSLGHHARLVAADDAGQRASTVTRNLSAVE